LRRVTNCLLDAGAASVSVAVVAVTPLERFDFKTGYNHNTANLISKDGV
jgi:hypothetical protein